jgi:hypothetical protein
MRLKKHPFEEAAIILSRKEVLILIKVEIAGIEPATLCMLSIRATNCAKSPLLSPSLAMLSQSWLATQGYTYFGIGGSSTLVILLQDLTQSFACLQQAGWVIW